MGQQRQQNQVSILHQGSTQQCTKVGRQSVSFPSARQQGAGTVQVIGILCVTMWELSGAYVVTTWAYLDNSTCTAAVEQTPYWACQGWLQAYLTINDMPGVGIILRASPLVPDESRDLVLTLTRLIGV